MNGAPLLVESLEKAIEGLKHYANRMDDGGTARDVLTELEKPYATY